MDGAKWRTAVGKTLEKSIDWYVATEVYHAIEVEKTTLPTLFARRSGAL